MKKKVFYLLFIYCLASSLFSIEIKKLKDFTLFQDDDVFISHPGSFFVTGDDLVFVLDYKGSNIKIFNTDGKLVNVFGKRGMGPDEFIRPYFSDYKKPFVVLVDLGRRNYFIYKVIEKKKLKFIKKCLNFDMPYKIKFIDEKRVLISGDKTDKNGKWYNLYIYDFENNETDLILPLETAYGYGSYREYEVAATNKIEYIGVFKYCDWTGDDIYLVWEGDIKILKFNRKTKGITFFGKKTGNYIQPYVTPEIKKAFNKRQIQVLLRLTTDMSYIMDLFVLNSKKIGLIYVGPLKKNKGVNVMMQLYYSSGEFIKEYELLNAKASNLSELKFYFRKDKNLFYVLDTDTSEAFDQVFKIHEYRIEE
jgi:hypothetical protein